MTLTSFSLNIILTDNQVTRISNAASGYHRVLQENEILYNSPTKGIIFTVFLGLREHKCILQNQTPFWRSIWCSVHWGFIGEDGSLLVNTSKMGKDVQKIFNFNKVFSTICNTRYWLNSLLIWSSNIICIQLLTCYCPWNGRGNLHGYIAIDPICNPK